MIRPVHPLRSSSPIIDVKGVGPAQVSLFARMGINTVNDLILHYPRRYEDYSVITSIKELQPGKVTLKAVVTNAKGRYIRRGMHITEATATDDSGAVKLVWFNQPYRAASIKIGVDYYISGEFSLQSGRMSLQNPAMELTSSFSVNTARLLPVYKETAGLSSKQIRAALLQCRPAIAKAANILPPDIIANEGMFRRAEALQKLHFPMRIQDIDDAKLSLGFEEVFCLSLASLLNKYELHTQVSPTIAFDAEVAKKFVAGLPFILTNDQRKTAFTIFKDLERTQPMNRLVEGDVGSGKTVVAAMAASMAMQGGFSVAIMAPTELLARQHAKTFYDLLKPLKMQAGVGLLVGSLPAKQKKLAQGNIASGATKLVVGTHALIQQAVDIKNLGLVIIDEQHRFGVEQRKKLQAKAGSMPHVLSMTATPIPRSLALTLYGELDVSIIAQKPASRLPIATTICSPNSRSQLYKTIDKELENGRQMFVVCPMIAESATLEAASAEKIYTELSKTIFGHRRVGLLHGKLKADEKIAVMEQFINKQLDILVSTTVIEVGVDIPNATVMLIESANRFGLAQLHQLRGRIGRGEYQGHCYLMLQDSKPASPRIRALEQSNDGFKLAELDLQLRGPGAIYGQMQHGQLDLRIAQLTDIKLIARARAAAQAIIDSGENLLNYTQLMEQVNKLRSVTNLN